MSQPSPWSIKGIAPEARHLAKLAAQREGVTLGAWLSSRIAETAGDAAIPATRKSRAARPAAIDGVAADGFEEFGRTVRALVASRDEVVGRLEALDGAARRLEDAFTGVAATVDSNKQMTAIAVRATALLARRVTASDARVVESEDDADGGSDGSGGARPVTSVGARAELEALAERLSRRCQAAEERAAATEAALSALLRRLDEGDLAVAGAPERIAERLATAAPRRASGGEEDAAPVGHAEHDAAFARAFGGSTTVQFIDDDEPAASAETDDRFARAFGGSAAGFGDDDEELSSSAETDDRFARAFGGSVADFADEGAEAAFPAETDDRFARAFGGSAAGFADVGAEPAASTEADDTFARAFGGSGGGADAADPAPALGRDDPWPAGWDRPETGASHDPADRVEPVFLASGPRPLRIEPLSAPALRDRLRRELDGPEGRQPLLASSLGVIRSLLAKPREPGEGPAAAAVGLAEEIRALDRAARGASAAEAGAKGGSAASAADRLAARDDPSRRDLGESDRDDEADQDGYDLDDLPAVESAAGRDADGARDEAYDPRGEYDLDDEADLNRRRRNADEGDPRARIGAADEDAPDAGSADRARDHVSDRASDEAFAQRREPAMPAWLRRDPDLTADEPGFGAVDSSSPLELGDRDRCDGSESEAFDPEASPAGAARWVDWRRFERRGEPSTAHVRAPWSVQQPEPDDLGDERAWSGPAAQRLTPPDSRGDSTAPLALFTATVGAALILALGLSL